MKWFEYLIILFAVALVVLPFILNKVNKKKNKGYCSGCSCCKYKDECHKMLNKNINEISK